MLSKTLKIGAVAVAMSFSTVVLAMPISGEIRFTGNAVLNAVPSAASKVIGFSDVKVLAGTGTYASITSDASAAKTTAAMAYFTAHPGDFLGAMLAGEAAYTAVAGVTLTPFQFSPSLWPSPVDPLWSVDSGAYTFRLDSITSVSLTGSMLLIMGEGLLAATGYDDTQGHWEMSTNGVAANISFSSNTIPEPSIFALVGLGLLAFGLVGVGRRGRSSSQMLAA